MNKEDEIFYEAPEVAVVLLNTEGVVCSSPVNANSQNYYWNTPSEE